MPINPFDPLHPLKPSNAPHRWGDSIACDPLALVSLALFCGMIAVWAAILG